MIRYLIYINIIDKILGKIFGVGIGIWYKVKNVLILNLILEERIIFFILCFCL